MNLLNKSSRIWYWFIGVALVTAYGIHVWLYQGLYIDDALITLRYVQQFVAGNGLVYNIGERVEGYSNFLWVMALTPFGWAGVDLIWATKFLGEVLGLATLLMVAWLARRLTWKWVAPALLVASAPFAAWTMGGLETTLFAFLLSASSIAFIHEEERQSGWLSGALLGLLALTRPEGLAFAGVAFLFRAWRWYRLRQWPTRHEWLWFVALGVVFAPHFLWRLAYYGYPLPKRVSSNSSVT